MAEVNPADLPPGSCPVVCDMDFSVGAVKTRDGIQGVYTFTSGEQTEVTNLGVSAFFPSGVNWSNPNNITINTPGTYAQVSLTGGQFSDLLTATTFGFTIPADATILGVQVKVNGKQSYVPIAPNFTSITVTLLGTSVTRTLGLPLGDGSRIAGGPSDVWGQTFTPTAINSASFGFSIQAFNPSLSGTYDISGVVVSIFWAPPGTGDFTFVKTFEQTDGTLLTLALDDEGTFWQEDVINNPGVLAPFYSDIEPDTFAVSTTQDDREYIALSNLQNGTDMPRQYNGQWVDRISQVGPGAPPSISFTSTTYPIEPSPDGITQAPPMGDPGDPSHLSDVLWSAGPGSTVAGNTITVYYKQVGSFPTADPLLLVGGGVVLSGIPNINGQDPNATYIITSLGQGVPPGGAANRWFFTVTATATASGNAGSDPTGQYQVSLATLTTTVPVPNLEVGDQIVVAGATPSGWNGSWTVLFTPNAAQLEITSTSLTSNIATYAFTLITGTPPTAGEQVTVTQTNNGNGIFNVQNQVILSAGPSSFSIALNAPNVAAAAETGQAIISGTIFQFDPGLNDAGTITSPIFGNGGGGTVTIAGNLGAGTRQAVVLFETRNGFITPASPPVTFTITEGGTSIVATKIPIGPPNVISRILAFTGAGGAFFFYIPVPVTITSNGQKTTYTATVVNDNTTTNATFTFTDAVLLAASSIDSQGANNFEEIELGSSTGVISYSQRLFAWGEQNKVQNFINMSFDGGYNPPFAIHFAPGFSPPPTPLLPLGWTRASGTPGDGGNLIISPLFGNSYYILNDTGSTQAVYGQLSQTAFQDAFQVAIINIQTLYSVRVTASCPGGIPGGANLNIDLFSPSFGTIYGIFSEPLSSMTPEMQIFTGTLLTNPFTTAIPVDLILRVYLSNVPNGGDCNIDRIEVFPTLEPVLSTQMRGSYFDNFEAFDDVTGNLGAAGENQQSIINAFELFDNLYIVKSNSLLVTKDNGITEPNFWEINEVSNKVGTPSIHGVDVGEGWAVIAGINGLYIFSGGQPTKISQEIDPLWQSINWEFGYTIWVRNDTDNRKILIGVPLPTPNQWVRTFPVNLNPTEPNVVLELEYKELMNSGSIAGEGPIRQTYTGELKTFQLGRRWSVWSIEAGYADFIKRPDTTTPLFYCGENNTSQIFQQVPGLKLDNGEQIPYEYISYPFVKTQEAQAIQLGLHQYRTEYATMLARGGGNVSVTVYPDNLDSPYQETLQPLALADPPPWGDTEFGLNTYGARFFFGFRPIEAGDWIELSRFILTVRADAFAPVRGWNG